MNGAAESSLIVFQVRQVDDIRALQNLAQSNWHQAADCLDAWCNDNDRIDQRVTDSYCATRQVGGMLGRIADAPNTLSNYRIYCSADPDLHHITGIAITQVAGDSCKIEFAVSHPENIPVVGCQTKARRGSVAVLIQHIVSTGRQFRAFNAEATQSGQHLFERIGFVAVSNTLSAGFLTPMTLVHTKTQALLSSLIFPYQLIELQNPLAAWMK